MSVPRPFSSPHTRFGLTLLLFSTLLLLSPVPVHAQARDPNGMANATQWAGAHHFAVQKATESSLFIPGQGQALRTITFPLPQEEEKALENLYTLYLDSNSANPNARTGVEALIAKFPKFFYAEYVLSFWHQQARDFPESRRLMEAAFADAPIIVAVPFRRPDGTSVANTPVFNLGIACMRVQNNVQDETIFLRFTRMKTDDQGMIYLPAYPTLLSFRLEGGMDGYLLSDPKPYFFESAKKVAVLPPIIATPSTEREFIARPDAPFKSSVMLPGGIKADLVSITAEFETTRKAWLPDGTPTTLPEVTKEPEPVNGQEEAGRRFDFRFSKPLPEDAYFRLFFSDYVEYPGEKSADPEEMKFQPHPVFAAFPTRPSRITIRFAYATGPWKEQAQMAAVTHALTGKLPSQFKISEGRNNTQKYPVVDLTYPTFHDVQFRVVALDSDNHEHFAERVSGGGNPGTRTFIYGFHSLDRTAVRSFRLDTRPFTFVDFTNIALQPRLDAKPSTQPATRPAGPTTLPRSNRGN